MKKIHLLLSLMILFVSAIVLSACKEKPEESEPTIIVEPIEFSVSLNYTTHSIFQGDSFILVATLDGITDYDSVGWAAEGDLLTIAPNGLNAVITAGNETGEETITITVIKGDTQETATCVITISPITLEVTVDIDTLTLNQGESGTVTVTIAPVMSQSVVNWTESGSLLTIAVDGNTATLTAGASTGTTTVTVAVAIFGQIFEQEIEVTVNEIIPVVDIPRTMADVNVGSEVLIDLEYITAYLSTKSFEITLSNNGLITALVNEDDQIVINGLVEGEVTLTITMLTNGIEYEDSVVVYVRPEGFVSVSNNVYDQFDLQLNFTESTYFSTIDESIWQKYHILLGSASNSGNGDLRGQFVFAMNHQFIKDGDKDVIQVMANGASAMAIRIPDSVDTLAAIEFSMKLTTLDPAVSRTWRMDFLIASVVDGKTTLYGRALDQNNGKMLGSLTIPFVDLLRTGYNTYRFDVSQIPAGAGNYIVIYFGNTTAFNGVDGDRTMIESFNFISKEQTGIELTTPSTKTEFVVGQTFDPTGLVVSSVFSLGNPVPINHSELVFEYDFSTAGNAVVKIIYGDYFVNLNVVVVEKALSSLEITTPPTKTIYTNGEIFDKAGMVVTARYNDDTSVIVEDYTYSMDPLVAGQTSIVLNYMTVSAPVTITVNTAAINSITVTTPPTKLVYVVGQVANYQGIVVTANFADLSTATIPFAELSISGFDSSVAVTGQVITVSYGGQQTTFTIDIIEKAITHIEIQRYPKIAYALGEEADWSLLIVNAVYNDLSKTPINLQDLVIQGFDSSVEGSISIDVIYLTFETSFNVLITDSSGYTEVKTSDMTFVTEGLVTNSTLYENIFIGETPASRDNYDVLLGRVVNDTNRRLQYSSTLIYFTGEGLEVRLVVNTNGLSALAVKIPDGMNAADITAFTFSMNGEHTAALATTVTFRPAFRFSSIVDGIEHFQAQANGPHFLPQSGGLTITHADFTRSGYRDYTVQITQPALAEGQSIGNYLMMYMGNNGSFSGANALSINSFKFWTRDVVADMSITAQPTKTEYVVGETFNPAGLVVTPLYGVNIYGAPTALNNSSLVFEYDFSTPGSKVVTVKYGDLTEEITVNVIEKVLLSIDATTLPTKVTYTEGEVFDPAGLVITATFNDASTQVIENYTYPMTPLALGQESIEISYEGQTVVIPITVNPASILSISVTTQPVKFSYVVGQVADYQGIVVTATYTNLATSVIPFENLVFSGFDSTQAVEDQVITVTYGEFTTTFTVDIIAKAATSIEIQTQPKVNYLVNEVADWTNLVVVLVYNDETEETVAFENLVITGFNTTVAGNIIVTIAYLSFETTLEIIVTEPVSSSDYVEVKTPDMTFVTAGLVTNSTLYENIFIGETPASRDNYDVLLGRVVNDANRRLQYSSTLIYFTGEGLEVRLVVNTNGLSALAVKIPDGMNAADITAFSFSMNAEHTAALATTVTFRPVFRFSSIVDGVEHFQAQANGPHFLPQSGAAIVAHADYTRAGYHDYTVQIDQPALAAGQSIGNYLLMYMGNNGSFSSANALWINGFKFWTREVITEISVTAQPTKTEYVVGQTFDSTGLVVTPTYNVSLYDQPTSMLHSKLEFIYDFSTAGTKVVTVKYGDLIEEVTVTVIEKALSSIAATTLPTKVAYTAGEVFDPAGLVITATFNDGSTLVIENYTYPMTPLVLGQETIEISYEGQTVLVPITVTAP
jgi:hypothetical protein